MVGRLRDPLSALADIAIGKIGQHREGGISLVLHDIGMTSGPDCVSLNQFSNWLSAWTQTTDRPFVSHPWPLPSDRKSWVHLCLDDAYEGALKLAVPALAERKVPFAIAVCAKLIGGVANWQGGKRARLADSSLIKEALSLGGVLLSHGMVHENLCRRSFDDVVQVVRQSRDSLEQEFCQPVRGLVYPYGHASTIAAEALEETGYTYGMTAVPGIIGNNSIPQLLPRCGLSQNMSTRQVAAIAQGGSIWRSCYLKRHFIEQSQ